MGVEAELRRRLRTLIKDRFGSIDRLYLETGLSKGHISDILRGKHSPSVATLVRLAKALDVEVVDLFQPRRAEKP